MTDQWIDSLEAELEQRDRQRQLDSQVTLHNAKLIDDGGTMIFDQLADAVKEKVERLNERFGIGITFHKTRPGFMVRKPQLPSVILSARLRLGERRIVVLCERAQSLSEPLPDSEQTIWLEAQGDKLCLRFNEEPAPVCNLQEAAGTLLKPIRDSVLS